MVKKVYRTQCNYRRKYVLGYISIIESIKGHFIPAIWFIILAMVCDGLDGKTARKLDAFSEFGKEFDSFCDAISLELLLLF